MLSNNPVPFRMNSKLGKELLALIRQGDLAHPGEAEAVKLLFEHIQPEAGRRVLDLGCGLGGTADLVNAKGLGQVTAVDIDQEAIAYAAAKYPVVRFICCDALDLSQALLDPRSRFDLSYMFNSLYTMADKRQVLTELSRVSSPSGRLLIFDFAVHSTNEAARDFAANYQGSHWEPVAADRLAQLFDGTGWTISSCRDISTEYRRWYESLVEQIKVKEGEIVSRANRNWFDHILHKFSNLSEAVAAGTIAGIIIDAQQGEQ